MFWIMITVVACVILFLIATTQYEESYENRMKNRT